MKTAAENQTPKQKKTYLAPSVRVYVVDLRKNRLPDAHEAAGDTDNPPMED